MLQRFNRGNPVRTELTWEEKNPADYRYEPSRAIKRLEKIVGAEETGKPVQGQRKTRRSEGK